MGIALNLKFADGSTEEITLPAVPPPGAIVVHKGLQYRVLTVTFRPADEHSGQLITLELMLIS